MVIEESGKIQLFIKYLRKKLKNYIVFNTNILHLK